MAPLTDSTDSIHRILGFRIAPPVVGRILNLTQLKPITANKLLKTYFNQGIEEMIRIECTH